ncbi:MAG TPA: hypothetical protein VGO46_18875 [Gemmatimonadaceae bacterium]|nr:hypothetical protein [Gemmatimonadaceae bacterium]
MTFTENSTMYAGKRRFARLSLVALGFLLACGEPTAPVTPVAKPTAPAVAPNANLVDIFNGLLNVTNGVTTLVGDLLPCAVTTEQWNTASIGPKGGRLNVGPHSLVIPAGALQKQTQITAHAVRGAHVRVEFSPSGLQFSAPATLTMSYNACAPKNKPVQVVYLKDDEHVSETEPSKDHRLTKSVDASIKHFSSYAVAY